MANPSERLEFPFNLDPYRGSEPAPLVDMQFQNYFPVSARLRESCHIVPIETDCAKIEKDTRERMEELSLECLYSEGKINIYPKKNTVDLRLHLLKKKQQ
jgi:hypothetical protein